MAVSGPTRGPQNRVIAITLFLCTGHPYAWTVKLRQGWALESPMSQIRTSCLSVSSVSSWSCLLCEQRELIELPLCEQRELVELPQCEQRELLELSPV